MLYEVITRRCQHPRLEGRDLGPNNARRPAARHADRGAHADRFVITSYSIHYTKLYEPVFDSKFIWSGPAYFQGRVDQQPGQKWAFV